MLLYVETHKKAGPMGWPGLKGTGLVQQAERPLADHAAVSSPLLVPQPNALSGSQALKCDGAGDHMGPSQQGSHTPFTRVQSTSQGV